MSDPFKDIAADETKEKVDDRIAYWTRELSLAHKREEKFQKAATRCVKLYEGDRHEDNSFNILYANTETLLPAIYNQRPRPFVDRRYKDDDLLAKAGAKTLERALTELQDTGDAEYENFNSLMEQAVLGALVPGRGVTWFKYDAKIEGDRTPTLDDGKGEGKSDGEVEPDEAETGDQTTGRSVLIPTGEKVVYETACGEDVDYDQIVIGYARRWAKVPWVARRHEMTQDDVETSFGEKWTGLLNFVEQDKRENWKSKDEEGSDEGNHQSLPVCLVWEIWNKEKKEVLFFSPGYKNDVIKVVPDPLKLSGFFPCWEPLRFLAKRSKLTPTPLYTLYEEQAKELNRITQRINRILGALKVRGIYDGSMQGLKELFNAPDNTFIAAKNVAALQDGKNLENSILFMPLEKLIIVLRELYTSREMCKSTIYEITGISDLMRGETLASETATAQTIKDRYGKGRINRFQRATQDYVRGCLRIMAEIAANHFSVETFDQLTNLDYALPEEVQQATQMQQALQQQMMQMQAMHAPMGAGGPPGMAPPGGPPQAGPPQPPPPPQPSPQMQQQMQQVQQILSKPRWEDVVGLLRDDIQRYYRIDIETNSTISADTTEDKTDIQDAMTALSNMFSSFQEAVVSGALPMPALKAMTLSVIRRFSFGREVEEAIQKMPDQLPTPPPPPGTPTPEELQATKMKAQSDIQLIGLKTQAAQRQDQRDQQAHGFQMTAMQREEQMAALKHQREMEKIQAQMQETRMKTVAVQQVAAADVEKARIGLEVTEKVGEHKVAQAKTQAQNAKKTGPK